MVGVRNPRRRRHPAPAVVALAALLGVLLAGVAAADAPTVARAADRVDVNLGNGTTLRFLLSDGYLLGLQAATVDGVALKSESTVQRPVLAQDAGEQPMIWPALRLVSAEVVNGKVELRCELLGTTDERAFRQAFVFGPDRARALREGLTPELTALQAKADAAQAAITAAIEKLPAYEKLAGEIAGLEKQAAEAKDAAARKKAQDTLRNRRERGLPDLARKLRPEVVQSSDELKAADQAVTQFEAALMEVALRLGKIHRDYHRFPMYRQPEEICNIAALRQQLAAWGSTLKPAGTLTWTLEPAEAVIAGWPWKGWKQHYAVTLADGRTVRSLVQMGTWELDGQAAGVTVVNLRFRGLGRIEQALEADGSGAVKQAWTTTETMPGAVGTTPLIAPVIPPSTSVEDRGFALRHRAGAWIARLARGAGVSFVDYQYRPAAALCSFFERQGNLRALSEAFPGDRCISQTDEEWFARTSRLATEPQLYLALVPGRSASADFWRNRWQEVDQYVRDLVCADLKFVQYDPLPGVGILSDGGWADYYRALAKSTLDAWARKGVRLVAYHNPGWINGRYQGPKGDPQTPPATGGGVCLVYDWWPAKDIQQPWKDAQAAFARNHIAFYLWIGTYNWADASFVESVGNAPGTWSVKADGVTLDDNHNVVAHNYLNPKTRQAVWDRLSEAWSTFGFQGFWVDSFQSTGMHRFTADDALAPQQRATWEYFAEWSRRGGGLMSESHAFPGLSCSIEVPGWEHDFWYFGYTWRWYRGDEQNKHKPEDLERLAFRFMANKAWTAPDKSYKTDDNMVIPSFDRFAHEYLAALPDLRRPYVLGETRGMLWLPFSGDDRGVWFSFSDQPVPAGVTATPILEPNATPATTAKVHTTYRVAAADLLKAFDVPRGPRPDPRLGRTWTAPQYAWPTWATSGPASAAEK